MHATRLLQLKNPPQNNYQHHNIKAYKYWDKK